VQCDCSGMEEDDRGDGGFSLSQSEQLGRARHSLARGLLTASERKTAEEEEEEDGR